MSAGTAWFAMAQHERKRLDHLTAAAGAFEEHVLQALEDRREFDERRTVAQGARLALGHGPMVSPVVGRAVLMVMAAGDESVVVGNHHAFGDGDQPLCVDPRAHRPVGERQGHAAAEPPERYQAGGRDPLALLKAGIELRRRGLQRRTLIHPHLGHHAGRQIGMLDGRP